MVETLKANVDAEKSRIISFIERTGPIVSNTIAKSLNLNSFLAAALLSELVNEKRANASTIRVGGSPLFFLDGQEEQLERFTRFLGHKEREAYELLKKEGVLQDKLLHPAIRVAIRGVKDFAIPLSVDKGGEETIFWKFRFFKDADSKIKDILKQTEEIKEEDKPEIKPDVVKERIEEIKQVKEIKEKKPRKISSSISIEKVLEKWASENKVDIEEVILAKGKDARAKITVKSEIGDIDFLLVLKNKKIISEADLAMAFQEGLNLKIPVIFLTPGKLNKQSQAYLDSMGKSIVLRKL